MVKAFYIPQKGDLVWLDFEPQKGKEIKKRRPALVLSPKEYNKHGLMLACPISSREKNYPFEVKIKGEVNGVILADSIKSLDWKERNASFIAVAPKETLLQVLALISVLLKP
jgi:mRNA interferase MazF